MSNLKVPDGLREEKHKHCGKSVWLGVLAPESRHPWLKRDDWVVPLAPRFVDGGDAFVHYMTLRVVTVPLGEGNLTLHRCPARVQRCRCCDEPVRHASRQMTGKVKVQKLDAAESDGGWFAVDDDGLVIRDPYFNVPGPRLRPHQCPANGPSRGRPRRPRDGSEVA